MDRRVNAYIGALFLATVVTVGLAELFDLRPPGETDWRTLPFLALTLVAASHLRVRFRRDDDVDAVTLFEAVLAPLIFAFPSYAVVATAAGVQVFTAVLRRSTVVKAGFNIAQWSLAAGVGSVVLCLLRNDTGVTVGSLGALVAALTAVALVNTSAFTLVLAISGHRSVPAVLRRLRPVLLPGWVGGWAVNTLMGLLFVMAFESTHLAVALFPVPLLVLHFAYRGFASARSDRVRMTGLREASQTLSAPLHPRDAIDDFLEDVTRCFESGGSALMLFTESGDLEIHQYDSDGAAPVRTEPAPAASETTEDDSRAETLSGLLAAQTAPTSWSATDTELLRSVGWRDCISAPLVDEHRRLGTLVVLDRTGVEGETAADLAVLEALARETAHTIARGRLFESVVEERRKLNQIVGTTSDGIFTLADDGAVLTWNAGCEVITGLSAQSVLGRRDALDRLRARSADGVSLDPIDWANDVGQSIEVLITRKNGATRRLSCSVSAATDVDLATTTTVVVARDITPEEEFEELREQVSRLEEEQAAQRVVVEHLQLAVAPQPPAIDGADIAVAYVASDPSSPTGGDLFDWHLLPNGELHVAVVDVLGHGVEATKHALLVVHALRFAAVDDTPLEQMVLRADQLLAGQDSEIVATVVIARYQPSTGELRVVSGGHPPALVVSADGEVVQLTATGGAIGWPGVGSDNVASTRLRWNESLVLYTDGLIEARKNVIDGMDSLVRHAGDVAKFPADQFADELVSRSLRGGFRRDDSLALVLRRTRTRSPAVPTRVSWDVVPGNSDDLRHARHGLDGWLAGQHLDSADAVLVAGELLANAVVVAKSSVVLAAVVRDDHVVLEVSDDGPGNPALEAVGLQLPPSDSERARGLFVVRSVAEDISMLSTSEGTVMQCRVPAVPVLAGASASVATGCA